MSVDQFAWAAASLMLAAVAFVLGHYVGGQSARRFYVDQLSESTRREMDAREELHRITLALWRSGRKENADG